MVQCVSADGPLEYEGPVTVSFADQGLALARRFEAANRPHEAQALRDAVETASTGTELLMTLRGALLSAGTLPVEPAADARALAAALHEALTHARG